MEGLDGFKALSDALQDRAQSGVINGLDGRPIRIQRSYAALNYLLQSAGAIICKMWLRRAYQLLKENNIEFLPLAFVHDEMQISVKEEDAQEAIIHITQAMKDVEHQLKFRCQLDSEAQIGNNWSECH